MSRISGIVAPRILYGVSKAAGHDIVPAKHPECAARIDAIEEKLADTGLLGLEGVHRTSSVVLASAADIAAVHNDRYFEILQTLVTRTGPMFVDGDTYVNTGSLDAALRSSGLAMQIADSIASASGRGDVPPVGFVLARPPGHHATPKGAMGFCIFNTVSVLARHCQQKLGYKRIAIFDHDVHHGNGTQDAFYSDPDVLFISTHQKGGYPGTGKMSETGEGDGAGTSINLVLPGDGGDACARATWEDVVAPAIRRHQPDIILVSAGYDAHWRDPLAQMQYRTSTFHFLTGAVKELAGELCGGRAIFCLEGGYDLKGLGESVADSFLACLDRASMDKFNPALLRDEPMDKVRQAIKECRGIHGL